MIKVISLDLWWTVLDRGDVEAADSWRVRECLLVLDHFGYTVRESVFRQAIDAVRERVAASQRLSGVSVAPLQQIEQILERCGIRDGEVSTYLEVPYCYAALRGLPSPLQGAVSAIQTLSGMGYTLVLTSNTVATPGSVIRQIISYNELDPYFSWLVFSDEIGVSKPSATVFRAIADRFKVQPNEILHVGDVWETDVLGSLDAGCRAIWLATSPTEDDVPTLDSLAALPEFLRRGNLW